MVVSARARRDTSGNTRGTRCGGQISATSLGIGRLFGNRMAPKNLTARNRRRAALALQLLYGLRMNIVLLYVVLSMVNAPAAPPPAALSLTFVNRHESTQLNLYAQGGGERPEALKEAKHFLRCWRTQREKPMDPRLLQDISQISQHFDNAEIQVVSGYRAKPYGAPHSKHFMGRAMDIQVVGVPARAVREFVWRTFRGVGVASTPSRNSCTSTCAKRTPAGSTMRRAA